MSEKDLNLDEDNNGEEPIVETPTGEEKDDKAFLDSVNEKTGKDFKSIDALAKTVKQIDKEFAKKGQLKEEVLGDKEEITQELLLVKNPEAETVLDDIKKLATDKYGGNLKKAYDNEGWIREKAKFEMTKRENLKKIKSPEAGIKTEEPITKLTDEDKRIADKYFGGDYTRYLKVKKN